MQHLQPGATLQGGKYKIEKVLGQGGFGITYLAEQPMLHRKVAVKEFFMKDLCNRDEATSHVSVPSVGSQEMVARFREKFLKEASLIAGMTNHHVVAIHDIFEEHGTAYYVMEHLDGGSLSELVDRGALNEDVALRYVRELADALRYIHQQNVLHLDVKPANVLLRSNGEAVLIDFGISKRYDDEGGQTSTTPVGISKGYAPVEQYNQGLTSFSPATDIYSLGATLYKMLTGKTPPEASLLLDDEEELVRPANVSFPTWVAVEKAMEPRRKRRPQSVDEFLALLGDGSQTPVAEHPAAPVVAAAMVEENEETCMMEGNEETSMVEESEEKVKEKPLQEGAIRFDVDGVVFDMIHVEGGTFDMKETVSAGFLGLSSREIVQKTTLSSYYIGETEVTQALWEAVMGSNPSRFKGAVHPVECVSWDDCQEFISKLNGLTGKNFRLPTEAEWEFAARGGCKSGGYEYSGGNDPNSVAWYGDNSGGTTHDVGTKQPNELGIYDMSGNVYEWCNDWYGDYCDVAQTNPTGSWSGSCRVIRGGCWYSDARYCRLSYRSSGNPDSGGPRLGLRLALSE